MSEYDTAFCGILISWGVSVSRKKLLLSMCRHRWPDQIVQMCSLTVTSTKIYGMLVNILKF